MNARQIFSWSVILCAIGLLPTHLNGQDRVDYAIVIHGGAGSAKIDADVVTARTRSLGEYLEAGVEMLKQGKGSLDVVEQVIRKLEDDPLYNAGRGAVITAREGTSWMPRS